MFQCSPTGESITNNQINFILAGRDFKILKQHWGIYPTIYEQLSTEFRGTFPFRLKTAVVHWVIFITATAYFHTESESASFEFASEVLHHVHGPSGIKHS